MMFISPVLNELFDILLCRYIAHSSSMNQSLLEFLGAKVFAQHEREDRPRWK